MASLNIRIDDEVKRQSEIIFSDLGLNTTTAINIFLKQVIRTKGIPFALQTGLCSEENNRLVEEQKRLTKV